MIYKNLPPKKRKRLKGGKNAEESKLYFFLLKNVGMSQTSPDCLWEELFSLWDFSEIGSFFSAGAVNSCFFSTIAEELKRFGEEKFLFIPISLKPVAIRVTLSCPGFIFLSW